MTRLVRRLADYSDPDSLGSRIRSRRSEVLLELLRELHAEVDGPVQVLDVGGTRAYWLALGDDVLDECDVQVTLVNVEPSDLVEDHPRFTFQAGDGCDLRTVADGEFDLHHSNSVVEHVGDWSRMEAFVAEARRTARRLYLQTPSWAFPVEPHFLAPGFHWLPPQAQAWLLTKVHLGHAPRSDSLADAIRRAETARLLRRAELEALLPEARIEVERIARLPKSLIALT